MDIARWQPQASRSVVKVGSNAADLVRSCAIAIVGIAALASPVRGEVSRDDLPQGQMKFRRFAAEDGLRNLVVGSIAQDGQGFLWLGTEDGVYRFDGERFTHFSIDDGLTSTLIYAVGVAPDGNACVGAITGLVCWDGTRFSPVAGLPARPVRAMVTAAGKLWVGTDAGLYVQEVSGSFARAPGWRGTATTPIRALWADGAGEIVVGNGATVELSSGNGEWRGIGEVGLGSDRVEGVLRDRQGALWIRTSSHMWLLPRGAARAVDLAEGLPTGYGVVNAPAMVIGPRGDVLLGTDAGIAYRDGDRWRVIDRTVGMPGAGARALFVDREGTLWIGSAGLLQLRGRGLLEYHDATRLPGDTVWSFRRDRRGTLWIGTSQCLAHAVGGRWVCLPGTEGRAVRSIAFPPRGGVFVGGDPSDLLYIDDAGRATSLGQRESPDRRILALEIGPDGDLWVATKAGLYRLPSALPGPLEQVLVPGIPAETRFGSFAVTGSQLWTTTQTGIAVLDRGVWRVFGLGDGFRAASISYVVARADGRVCAAYTEAIGLTCFRYDGRSLSGLKHISIADGLSTGMVYFLGEDRQQHLWIGTGYGVDVMTSQGIDHFDESDGLAGSDSAATAFMMDSDGSLWLGSTGGATHVFAQHYSGPPSPPRIVFLGGQIGVQPIRGMRGTKVALEVPHDYQAMLVDFVAGSLLDARRVEYQMRLRPSETAWSPTRQREGRYPALSPGDYRFEVRARIGAGAWGPTEELRFAVLPSWWRTSWFLVVSSVIGILAIVGGFAWRQRTVLRRRTRQLHERSDASFRAVIDLMPDLISVHRDGNMIYLNRASRRFLGIEARNERWDAAELAARIHPDDLEVASELFIRIRDADGPVSEVAEIRMRGADGSWRICEVSGVRVEIAGAPTVVASGRDVTERKRMRAKLLVSDRMASLGTLAAGIAHEINNPLAYVTGNLEAMAEVVETGAEAPTPGERAELRVAIEEARDGAERVRKIVQGLRSFSRSEEEKRVPLALPGVLEAAIRLTGNEVRHCAQLVRELGAVPRVVADDGQLTQVFINLLVNAAHAIPEGRSDDNRITVRTRTDEQGRAVVEIEDTGRGMPPEVQARVFDPFFTTKDVGEGTGLGLSICHGIVSGLGGQIAIESAPERGTVVRVVLPPYAGPPVPEPPPATPGPGKKRQRRRRVMLVDDEPQVAYTMERLLRRDYDITVALCGRDAIEHIANGKRFDAIVSDVMMPNMTGIELVEEIRRVAPEQAERLIFLSGGAFTAQTREQLDELGAPQLQKPVTAKELRAWVLRIATDTDSIM